MNILTLGSKFEKAKKNIETSVVPAVAALGVKLVAHQAFLVKLETVAGPIFATKLPQILAFLVSSGIFTQPEVDIFLALEKEAETMLPELIAIEQEAVKIAAEAGAIIQDVVH
jgi:hypothetical protein